MKERKKGFTLVELLVVIAIIAIIAAVAVPVTIGQVNKAKNKTAEREVSSLYDMIELAGTEMGIDTTKTLESLITKTLPDPEYIEYFTVQANNKVVVTIKSGATITNGTRTFTHTLVQGKYTWTAGSSSWVRTDS